MEEKRGLGRGLDALLGGSYTGTPKGDEKGARGGIYEIDVELIQANPDQPRERFDEESLRDLKESIHALGIIQPITLRRIDRHSYQIISGERRFRAAKMAGLNFIPAYIREANDTEIFEMALVENIQREDLNPIEVALSYQKLIEDFQLPIESLAARVGKNRSTVQNFLRLLKLPDTIQFALKEKKISMGHARALINIEGNDKKEEILEMILTKGLSVRQVEALTRELGKESKKKKGQGIDLPLELRQKKEELAKKLNTKVEIKRNLKGKGSLTIHFDSDEKLQNFLDKLQ